MTKQMNQISMEEEVWSLMNPQIDELSSEDQLGAFVHSGKFEQIGVYLESLLVSQMITADGNPAPLLMALTKQHIATVQNRHETHDKRMLACRMAGRFFSQQLEEQIEYLVQLAPIWISGTKGYNGPVKDDPLRREGAMCVVMEMKDLYSAETFDEYLEALEKDNTRIWQVAMHEGYPQDVIHDGIICQRSSSKQVSPDDSDELDINSEIIYIDNHAINELLVGLSPGLPIAQKIGVSPNA